MTGTPPAWSTTAPAWFKSSYSSSGDGNDCVEVAMSPDTVLVRDSKNTEGSRLSITPTAWANFTGSRSLRDTTTPTWCKSSYSDSSNPSDCVEVAMVPGAVLVRDSKNTRGPRLTLTPVAWADFLGMAGFASRG